MKKLLNISVIAALAVLPFAANAEVGDVVSTVDPAHADSATVTSTNPGYALATETANDSNLATAGYVKGAYNATIKAVNKVATTAANAADKDLSNLSETGTGVITTAVTNNAASGTFTSSAGLTSTTLGAAIDEVAETAGSAVQSVAEGATNGTVSVDGTDVAVHGLGSAAYADTTDFDAAGTGAAIEGKLNDGATGYDIDAKTLKVQGADVLTGASLTDYAKKIGVTHTISSSTISGTVPTVTTWGTETTGTAPITASITGATYTETAPTPANP